MEYAASEPRKLLVIASNQHIASQAVNLARATGTAAFQPLADEIPAHALIRVRPTLVLIEAGRPELEDERFLHLTNVFGADIAVFESSQLSATANSPLIGATVPFPIATRNTIQ